MQALGIQVNKGLYAQASQGAHSPSDDHTDKCPVTSYDKGNVQGAPKTDQLQEVHTGAESQRVKGSPGQNSMRKVALGLTQKEPRLCQETG